LAIWSRQRKNHSLLDCGFLS